MSNTCTPHHDWFTTSLTSFLCIGLVISYAPQLYRIVQKGSSQGFNPWFLLLGSTSSASGFLNMVTMQWRIARCCTDLSLGSCVELTLGIVQVGLQWLLFTAIFVLYMIYFPARLKYAEPYTGLPEVTREWSHSIYLASAAAIHFLFSAITTIYLLSTNPSPPGPGAPLPAQVLQWATFLGLSSAALATIQYTPQLIHTYNSKLVGALSIPMMCLQSPGGILMVLSIALRPGTNWTSWITFAVAAVMQCGLLIMCIAWTFRQRRLGIDDFGNPLPLAGGDVPAYVDSAEEADALEEPGFVVGEETPLLGNAARNRKGI